MAKIQIFILADIAGALSFAFSSCICEFANNIRNFAPPKGRVAQLDRAAAF